MSQHRTTDTVWHQRHSSPHIAAGLTSCGLRARGEGGARTGPGPAWARLLGQRALFWLWPGVPHALHLPCEWSDTCWVVWSGVPWLQCPQPVRPQRAAAAGWARGSGLMSRQALDRASFHSAVDRWTYVAVTVKRFRLASDTARVTGLRASSKRWETVHLSIPCGYRS